MHYVPHSFQLGRSLSLTGAVALIGIAAAAAPLWAAAILPSDIPGLQAWYRVDHGITTVDGAVSYWEDSSGLGRHMAQTDPTHRPLLLHNHAYGPPAVDFTSTARFLTAGNVSTLYSSTEGMTAICVVHPRSLTTGSVVASQYTYGGDLRRWRAGARWFIVDGGGSAGSGSHSDFAGVATGQWSVLSGVWNPAQGTEAYVNGKLVDSDPSPVPTIVTTPVELMLGADHLGGGNALNGLVSEVILFDRALSEPERQGVERYLQRKYAPPATQTRHAGPFLEIDVNFEGTGGQASNQPLPPSYRVDAGQTFRYHDGELWSWYYGWDKNNTGGRNRNSATSPDERFDTLTHMYARTDDGYVPYTWELALPNGEYWVRAVFGDVAGNTSRNDVYIQDTLFIDPDPGLTNEWDEYFGTFMVTDGRLTITPYVDTEPGVKLSFVQVREVFMPDIAINFQSGTSADGLPGHYLVDSGAAFGDRGNGLTYGWLRESDDQPASNPGGRIRNNHPDRRYDTLNHMSDYYWEIELENGLYSVLAMFGESCVNSGCTSTNHVWIEGTLFHDPDPGLPLDHDLFMGTVRVTDGRLTIRMDPSSTGAKINFLEITMIPEPSTAVLLAFALLIALAGTGHRKRNEPTASR